MTYREAFLAGQNRLASGPVATETPDLDARVLLGHAAGLGHAQLLARWPEALDPAVEATYQALVGRRAAGEPVAYLTGTKEFLGMEFEVGPGLLVPRADTETLVDAALEVAAAAGPRGLGAGARVADVCTGTGCVAVGLAALAPEVWDVWAGDMSPVAVAAAGRNAGRLLEAPRKVTVVASDLLAQLPGPFHLIVSNPPYLTPAETADRVGPGAWQEPALALDGGGDDGLDLIRRLVAEAAARLVPWGWLLIEAGGPQMEAVGQLLRDGGFEGIRVWKDLAGTGRVAGGRLSGR